MAKLDSVTKLIGECPKDINTFFENWSSHTENDRLEVIRALREVGHLSAKYKTNEMGEEFRCPIYNFTLVKLCSLTSCAYHISSKNADTTQMEAIVACNGCLINCLDKAKNNRMSANETSVLLGTSVSEINSVNTSAVLKIKRTKIKEHLEKYQIPRYKYIKGHCVCCEQYIQDELDMNLWPDLIIEHGSYGWCSTVCKDHKPKWQFLIEKEFECQFLHAIGIALLLYKNLESLSNLFGINKDIIQKHKQEISESVIELKKFFIEDN
jgi:hypothetical protein